MGKGLSNTERLILVILKNPDKKYNSNSISKIIGISSMGALKIAKNLEKEKILLFEEIGKAKIFKLNLKNDYVLQYVSLLLRSEAEQSNSGVKKWITEIKKIKNADSAILFGSVLHKEEPRDIDVLFIVEKNKLNGLKKEIEKINFMNNEKIHPVFQTNEDFYRNVEKNDKIILNVLKGIVIFGENKFLENIKK